MGKIRDKIFVLTHENCGPCKKIVPDLQGKLPIYDLGESDEAFSLLKEGVIDAVPSALEYDGKKYQKCKIAKSEDGKIIVIECPNSRIEVEVDK